jgi:short-subunit dehydrogenase
VIHTNTNGTVRLQTACAAVGNTELNDTGVTVTCLMPGATETNFFDRAEMTDTKVGTGKKAHASDVAKTGFDAMMKRHGRARQRQR